MTALSELYQIEEAFESAFKAIFIAAGLTNTYKSRQVVNAQTPWVEVKFLVGSASAKRRTQINITGGCQFAYTGWTGSALNVTVVTQRANNGTQHKTYLGKIRNACQMHNLVISWPSAGAGLSHAIADIREIGTNDSFDDDNHIDKSVITFHLSHNIRDDAITS